MKLIIAVIQPHKLEDVLQELDREEVYLKTVSNVLGCGRQKGKTEIYRGKKETGNLLKKVRLEIAVNEKYVEPTISAIIVAPRLRACSRVSMITTPHPSAMTKPLRLRSCGR